VGVDRSFLHRHHDLRAQILAVANQPEQHSSTRASRQSLLATLQDRDDELATARAANRDLITALNVRATRLVTRLDET
jgi:hypothetical protein